MLTHSCSEVACPLERNHRGPAQQKCGALKGQGAAGFAHRRGKGSCFVVSTPHKRRKRHKKKKPPQPPPGKRYRRHRARPQKKWHRRGAHVDNQQGAEDKVAALQTPLSLATATVVPSLATQHVAFPPMPLVSVLSPLGTNTLHPLSLFFLIFLLRHHQQLSLALLNASHTLVPHALGCS